MGLPLLKDTYSDDSYIVGIATDLTSCFGLKFEVQNETCRSCPLAGSCQGQFYVNLSSAAEEVANRRPEEKPSENVDTIINEALSSSDPKVTRFEAFADSICCVCGEKVSQGTEAFHHMRDGFFHLSCLDEYHKGTRHGS